MPSPLLAVLDRLGVPEAGCVCECGECGDCELVAMIERYLSRLPALGEAGLAVAIFLLLRYVQLAKRWLGPRSLVGALDGWLARQAAQAAWAGLTAPRWPPPAIGAGHRSARILLAAPCAPPARLAIAGATG
jgi:hypothetical protein